MKNLVFLALFSLLLAFKAYGGVTKPLPERQAFLFHYHVEVPEGAITGKDFSLWIPLPKEELYQKITQLKINSPWEYQFVSDKEDINRFLYIHRKPVMLRPESNVMKDPPKKISIDMRIERGTASISPGKVVSRYLKSDRLVPIDHPKIKALVEKALSPHVTLNKDSVIPSEARDLSRDLATSEKIKRLYDFVKGYMTYNKKGTGWGNGDAIFACDYKRGNCTDFHALFMAMARSQKIAARFKIGFPIPVGKTEGVIAGYHCWAEAYDPPEGWIPLDLTEGHYRTLPPNRVELTAGRDIILIPRQKGAPLNYVVYPYAELEGKPYSGVATRVSFEKTS